MGTQLYWFYDVLLVAIVLATTFRCYKKGFVSVIIGFATITISFVLASLFSAPLAEYAYDGFIDDKVNEYISDSMDNFGGGNVLYELSNIKSERVKINGVYAADLVLVPDSAGKITLDISNLDYSETGLSEIDLGIFGMNTENTDFNKINAGKVNLTPDELRDYPVGKTVLARTLAQFMQSESVYGSLSEMLDKVSAAVPFFDPGINVNDSVAKVIRTVISSDATNLTASMVDGMIKPVVIPPLKAILFFLIFIISAMILSIITKVFKLVNRVPVIGGINSFFGAVVGVAEGFLIVAIVCVIIHIIISLTGNTIVLLNTMTIEKTTLFRHIYGIELLNINL